MSETTTPDIYQYDQYLPDLELTSSDQESVERFKEFLRIPSITAHCNTPQIHTLVAAFLRREAEQLGLEYRAYEYSPGWFVFVLSWIGSKPELDAILLNSHYDVVPHNEEMWHWPPFDAIELENGDIVARGAQDMKCVCVQHLEAIRRLRNSNYIPERSIHLAFQPDEELGGTQGMGKWIHSLDFKNLHVGFALDEGIASIDDKTTVFYGERAVWWLGLRAVGPTGHSSRFIQHTAVEKLLNSVNKFLDYRREQEKLLETPDTTTSSNFTSQKCHETGCKHAIAKKLGDVVTLNLTVLKAGITQDNGKTYSLNVIPQEAYAGFDIRVPPTIDLVEFEDMLKSWLDPDVSLEFIIKTPVNNKSNLDETMNKYWKHMKLACERNGVKVDPQIFPAATDGRYLRNVHNLPVFGFSPITYQPILLHDHDERLNKKVFIHGIKIFEEILRSITLEDLS